MSRSLSSSITHLDWPSLGLPDPDSPAGRHFDWGTLRIPHPNSPAARYLDYSSVPLTGNTPPRIFTEIEDCGSGNSTEPLSPKLQPQPNQDDGSQVIYFDYLRGMDILEFERALKMAEDEINHLSPQEYLNRLMELEKHGAKAQRDKNGQARARKIAMQHYKRAMPCLFHTLKEEYPQLTAKEAAASLTREVGGSKFQRLHIEHRLDIGGGGKADKFAGLGDGAINSLIGAQWKQRRAQLKRYAEEAARRGQKTMRIRLAIRG